MRVVTDVRFNILIHNARTHCFRQFRENRAVPSNGALSTVRKTTTTEHDTMNDNDRPDRYQEGVDRHDGYELAFCTGHGYSVVVENGDLEVNWRMVNPECN